MVAPLTLLLHKLHDFLQLEIAWKAKGTPKTRSTTGRVSIWIFMARETLETALHRRIPLSTHTTHCTQVSTQYTHKYHLSLLVRPVITLTHHTDHRGRSNPRQLAQYTLLSFVKRGCFIMAVFHTPLPNTHWVYLLLSHGEWYYAGDMKSDIVKRSSQMTQKHRHTIALPTIEQSDSTLDWLTFSLAKRIE